LAGLEGVVKFELPTLQKKLIWGGDHSYDECGVEGEGIVSNLSCPNEDCGVEQVLVYCNLNKEVNENSTND
jgi:hypothetical protein